MVMISNIPEMDFEKEKLFSHFEEHLIKHQTKIEAWFRQQWKNISPPIYGSVDLRNSGFKLAPIDMNLFPAGFNNLNPNHIPLCIQAIQDTVELCRPGAMRILLIPESHTRNIFYLESLSILQEMISKSGFDVRVGSLRTDIHSPEIIELPSGKHLYLEPISRHDNRIVLDDFDPCLIWLNNDMSDTIPDILKNLEQTVRPPLKLGWNHRLKSGHFSHYEKIAEEFSHLIDMDSWRIHPLYAHVDHIDFLKKEGLNELHEKAEKLFESIHQKYQEYQIEEKPFLMMKADNGTYGMSVMPIFDPKEILELNRKERTHMSSKKGGQKVSQVILQEGVYTFETLHQQVAEPVVYMIGKHVVGGFYRVHQKRGRTENLNSPGMYFEPLPFCKVCNCPDSDKQTYTNRFYVYGVIARLSMLAAAYEKKALGEK